MAEQSGNLKVILVDPACFSLYYDLCYADAVARLGVDVELLTSYFKYDYIEPPQDVRVRYTFFKLAAVLDRYFDSRLLRRVYRVVEYPFDVLYLLFYCKTKRADIVHFMWCNLPLLDYWAIRILRILGIKIVYTAHNAFPHEVRSRSIKKYCSIYAVADRIIVLTEYVRRQIVGRCGADARKISTIPHGNYNCIMDRLNVTKGRGPREGPVICFIGLIRPYKGLAYLIKAFALVQERIPSAKLLIMGKPLERFDKYARMIRSLGLEDKVLTELRYLTMRELVSYLKNVDLVVFPYVSASQSGSLAMLYELEKPVVVTSVGGLPEMAREGVTGSIVPPANEERLSSAILGILDSGTVLEGFRKSAKEFGRNNFSWEILAPKAHNVYLDLMRSKR